MCPVFHCRSTRDTLQCGILIRCEVEEAFLDRDLGGGKTARSHGAVRAAAGGNGVDAGLITFTDVVERRAPQSETRYVVEAGDKQSRIAAALLQTGNLERSTAGEDATVNGSVVDGNGTDDEAIHQFPDRASRQRHAAQSDAGVAEAGSGL